MKNQGGFGVILMLLLVFCAMAGMLMSILVIYEVQRENEQLTEQLNQKECYKVVYNKPPELEVCSATSTKIYDQSKFGSWIPQN